MSDQGDTSGVVPLVTMPIADRNGNITEPWLMFLYTLLRRTGGDIGFTLDDVWNISFSAQQTETAADPFVDASPIALEQLFALQDKVSDMELQILALEQKIQQLTGEEPLIPDIVASPVSFSNAPGDAVNKIL